METDTGLVLEGGGFRGIFTAAVLDVFLKQQILFPYVIGVSAGAAYGVSFVSRQFERNLALNKVVSDKRYCSLNHFLRTGNYFNWEFVYKEVPLHVIPFQYKAFSGSGVRMRVGITNGLTGRPEYLDLEGSSPDRFRDLLTATSSLPLISKMKRLDGQWYMDGGIADAIPVQQALQEGNRRVVVILTREAGYRKKRSNIGWLLKIRYPGYPGIVKAFHQRTERYNQTLDKLEFLQQQGKAFVIRPKQAIAVSRMENKTDKLDAAYYKGIAEAQEILPQLKAWLRNS